MPNTHELLISDITEMGPGYCVLGIEPAPGGRWRTVRPVPQGAYAWPREFPHQRGHYIRADLSPTETDPPHFEDHAALRLTATNRTATEEELVACLRQAELAASLLGLFGTPVQPSPYGGGAVWVHPYEASRSVSGCVLQDVRFEIFDADEEARLRCRLLLASGEALHSLPVVDRGWNWVLRRLLDAGRAQEKLNGPIRERVVRSKCRLARIGLARPKEERCWLMLDSLFPEPKESWLE